MGALSFNIEFRSKGGNIIREIADDLNDFSEVFSNVMDEWALHNTAKFERSRGAEASGVQQASDLFWQPLSDSVTKYAGVSSGSYRDRKRHDGFEDWLMVRTGALANALTERGGFYEAILPTQASFGSPQESEEQDKLAGNWIRRQVLFLDIEDQRMIRQHFHDYLEFGAGYLEGKERVALTKLAMANLDSGFAGTVQ